MDETRKILPTLAVVGLVLIILSCAWYETYLPLITLPFMILAPFPMVMVGSMSGGPMSVGPSQSARESALFLTSSLASSALIVPFFLYHVDKILFKSACLAASGAVFLFVTVIIYQICFNTTEEDSF